MPRLILGIDVGTSAVKVSVSADGAPAVPTAHAPVPWTTMPTGAEMDPDLLWDVVLGAVDEACGRWPGAVVDAVGVASFAESVVLLDRHDRPVTPLVAWHDNRGGPEAAQLTDELGQDAFSTLTGLPVSPLCSAVKVRASAAAGVDIPMVAMVLSATDWIVFRLTGKRAFDLSLAARTGWLDLGRRCWAGDVVSWTGLPARALPDVLAGGTSRGVVRPGRAGAVEGLAGALVVAAGMDHLVAAVGAGASTAGDVWDSCGTAEAVVRSTLPLEPAAVLAAVRSGLTVGWHADPTHQVVLGAQRSGYAFERVLRLLGVHTAEQLRELEGADLPEPGPAGQGPAFHDLYGAAYGLRGLTSTTGPREVWSALVERVAADGAQLVEVVDRVAGPHRRIVMGGGWSASRWFHAAKQRHHADVVLSPVEQPGAAGAVAIARAALEREGGSAPGAAS